MKVERLRSSDGAGFQQTSGVSSLLPESKILELYNIGANTRKPRVETHLHQLGYGSPVISITFAAPAFDSEGRNTTMNSTFLVSLMEVTQHLERALTPFYRDVAETLEPIEIGEFTVINPVATVKQPG